jgi:hypothetical protein
MNLKMRINRGLVKLDELGVVLYKVFLKWVGMNLHLVNRRSLNKT